MRHHVVFLAALIAFGAVSAFPQGGIDDAFVVATTEAVADKDQGKEGDEAPKVPKIYEMNVFSNVSNRFAHTSITTKVKNLAKTAQEATFSVVLPDSAYIRGFIMEIGGKNYTAYVKEKEEAKKVYDQAVSSGFGAAHVAASARDSNRFTVSVNVEPASKAVFYLTYEELLKRRQHYELVINIHPKQPVPNLNVEVQIKESKPLKFVKAPPIRSGNEVKKYEGDLDSRAKIENVDDKTAIVKFSPDIQRQKEYAHTLGTKEDEGLSGQFVVEYDVERDSSGGEILVKDGYFVHFFAPENIKPLPKHVVFVLDTSGSMYGQRIEQLKEAMSSILKELKNGEDLFHLVDFNSEVTVWNVQDPSANKKFPVVQNIYEEVDHKIDDVSFPDAAVVDPDIIKKANEIVNNRLFAEGGTNIYEALKVGIQLVKIQKRKGGDKKQPLIIFLTDGEPTVGFSNPDKIRSKVSEINQQIPIFSLSFGDGADKNFLQKLSLQNDGFSRHIYEAADASLQLQDFYKEISSPLLSNVSFNYTQEAQKLTKTVFPNYFGGGEIIVSGAIDGDSDKLIPKISCWGVEGPREFTPKVVTPVGELERLWVYLTIQQLLDQKETAKNKTDVEKRALDLALKYSFVTPLTSLVVVKPNETKPVDTEAADTPDFSQRFASLAAVPQFHSFSGASSSFALAGPPGLRAPMPAFGGGFPIAMSPFFSKTSSISESFHTDSDPTYDRMDVDSSYDRIIGGPYTTPFIPLRSTTTRKPTTTVGLSPLNTLLSALPWLRNIRDDNDNLTLAEGVFKLGWNETLSISPECNNAPNNSTGHCTLLHRCTRIHSELDSVEKYSKHFCALNEYAGVCCP